MWRACMGPCLLPDLEVRFLWAELGVGKVMRVADKRQPGDRQPRWAQGDTVGRRRGGWLMMAGAMLEEAGGDRRACERGGGGGLAQPRQKTPLNSPADTGRSTPPAVAMAHGHRRGAWELPASASTMHHHHPSPPLPPRPCTYSHTICFHQLEQPERRSSSSCAHLLPAARPAYSHAPMFSH